MSAKPDRYGPEGEPSSISLPCSGVDKIIEYPDGDLHCGDCLAPVYCRQFYGETWQHVETGQHDWAGECVRVLLRSYDPNWDNSDTKLNIESEKQIGSRQCDIVVWDYDLVIEIQAKHDKNIESVRKDIHSEGFSILFVDAKEVINADDFAEFVPRIDHP